GHTPTPGGRPSTSGYQRRRAPGSGENAGPAPRHPAAARAGAPNRPAAGAAPGTTRQGTSWPSPTAPARPASPTPPAPPEPPRPGPPGGSPRPSSASRGAGRGPRGPAPGPLGERWGAAAFFSPAGGGRFLSGASPGRPRG